MKYGYVKVTNVFSSNMCPNYLQVNNKKSLKKEGKRYIEEFTMYVPEPKNKEHYIKYLNGEWIKTIVEVLEKEGDN